MGACGGVRHERAMSESAAHGESTRTQERPQAIPRLQWDTFLQRSYSCRMATLRASQLCETRKAAIRRACWSGSPAPLVSCELGRRIRGRTMDLALVGSAQPQAGGEPPVAAPTLPEPADPLKPEDPLGAAQASRPSLQTAAAEPPLPPPAKSAFFERRFGQAPQAAGPAMNPNDARRDGDAAGVPSPTSAASPCQPTGSAPPPRSAASQAAPGPDSGQRGAKRRRAVQTPIWLVPLVGAADAV